MKHIEGVEKVNNQIEVLPTSTWMIVCAWCYTARSTDTRRWRSTRLGVQKPIRIIVKNGHVTLEGVVDNEGDKNFAGMRANGVPGIFSVTNNLQVEK